MEKIFGLPVHPLVVHIPVAMLPLAVIGVGFMLVRRSWYERYRWAVLGIGAIGTLGAIIATSSGESLQERIGQKEGQAAARAIGDHAEAGDLARTLAIVFFVALAAYVLVPWYLHRRAAAQGAETPPAADVGPRWLRPTLMVAVALTAIASTVSIVEAGHSGAGQAWEGFYDESVGG
jgi:uncharacterized membrane protein